MSAPSVEPALLAAAAELERLGLAYCVIGGIAAGWWSIPRATKDVDFKVLVPGTDYAGVRTSISKVYPVNARPNAPENKLILSVDVAGVAVDFLLAVPGFDEGIVNRAVPAKFSGRSVPICTAEDLIVMKAIAGRGQDWLDIERLLAVRRGELDFTYLENWLGQFAEALEDPEMLSRFEALRKPV